MQAANDEKFQKNANILDGTYVSDPAGVAAIYDNWSADYEEDVNAVPLGYPGPRLVAADAAQYLTDKDCRILDLCCGTGLGGEALRQHGFTNIDGIDGSDKMLEVARAKSIYRNIFHEIIEPSGIKSVENGSYKAVVNSGSFIPGHMSAKHLAAIVATLHSNGYFCMAMRAAYLQTDELQDLEDKMAKMESDGVWKRIERKELKNYNSDLPGVAFVYQKL